MQNAIAFCDNDVVVVAWSYGHKVEGCMGFAVVPDRRRRQGDGAAFDGGLPGVHAQARPDDGELSDPEVLLEGSVRAPGRRPDRQPAFRYKIVPLAGKPGSLKPMTVAFLVSNEIEIGPIVAPQWRAFFNRGLISTQRVSTALGGKPAKGALLAAIAPKGGKLRVSLAGDMIPALLDFVRRAKAGGTLYAALYELGDDELIAALEKAPASGSTSSSRIPMPAIGRSASADQRRQRRRRERASPRRPASWSTACSPQQPDRPQQVRRLRRQARQARGGAVRLDQLDADRAVRADQQHHRLRRCRRSRARYLDVLEAARQGHARGRRRPEGAAGRRPAHLGRGVEVRIAIGDGGARDELVLAQHAEAARARRRTRSARPTWRKSRS